MNADGVQAMRTLIAELPDQLAAAWAATQPSELPGIARCSRLLACGMGGSAAAAEICAGTLAGPGFEIAVNRSYTLNNALRDDDLVVFSSYSGDTEETLACFDDVQRRRPGGPSLAISSGGQLTERARAAGLPVLELPPGLPPRASLGHGIGRLCGVLAAVGIGGVASQVEATIERLHRGHLRWGLTGTDPHDRALGELAVALDGRLVVIYAGAAPAIAAARRLRAQLNENAKVLAFTAQIPELDHNEIVGWSRQTAYRDELAVLALRDPEEHPQVRRRFEITREVLGARVPAWFELEAAPGPTLARSMELVQAGDLLSVLLAERAAIDPMPVQPIDELKARLA